MGVIEGLKASGLEADIGMMAEHFGVSELDFVNQVIDSLQEDSASEGEQALQRLTSRIDLFKDQNRPKLTLVTA